MSAETPRPPLDPAAIYYATMPKIQGMWADVAHALYAEPFFAALAAEGYSIVRDCQTLQLRHRGRRVAGGAHALPGACGAYNGGRMNADIPARLREEHACIRRVKNVPAIESRAQVVMREAADEIERLRAEVARLTTELTVANNRLGNAVGAIIDTGNHYCTGPADVAAAIGRLTAERNEAREDAENLRVILAGADYPFEM